jgi:nucleotidyltransferase/DNA polymerase involved in DNA repair
MSELLTIPGIGRSTKNALEAMGVHTKTDLAGAKVQDLTAIRGVTEPKAEAFVKAAQGMTTAPSSGVAPSKELGEAPANVVNLVSQKPFADESTDANAVLKAAKRKRKKAKAKLKTATAKLKKAIKALKKYKEEALKGGKKAAGKDKADGKAAAKISSKAVKKAKKEREA